MASEALLNGNEKERFQRIVEKRDKTEDEDFLIELIHHIAYNSQLRYLYGSGNYNPRTIAYSDKVLRTNSVRRDSE